jgi:hypothetical protein
MRKLVLIRCGIASVLLGGAVGGLFAAGCGGDDNGGSANSGDAGNDATDQQPGDDATPGTDGGTPTDGSPATNPDGSPVNGGDGGPDGAPAVQDGKLILVHAAMYAPSLRFCFGSVSGTGDAGTITVPKQAYPLPANVQGVPPGTGGPSTDQGDFSDRSIELYAINAAKLTAQLPDSGTELNCAQLLGSDGVSPNPANDGGLGLVEGTDYWDIGMLPKGTLAQNSTTLAVVTGCGVGAPQPVYNCPGSVAGSLGLWYKTLDTTTALDAGTIGAQFAYTSYPFASLSTFLGGAGSTALAGMYQQALIYPDAGTADTSDAGGDAGDAAVEASAPTPVLVTIPQIVAGGVNYGELKPATLALGSSLTLDNNSGFFVQAIGADGGTELAAPSTPLKVAIPFPTIHDLSWGPGVTTGVFQNGTGYVFILVGDPQLPSIIGDAGQPSTTDAGGTFNPFSAHILGFPTNPPVSK